MIKARNLAYEYNRRDSENNVIAIERALDGVTFDIEDGQFVSIVGHNGSGKSTLAKHMNALFAPTEGTVWVNGIDTKNSEMILDIRQNTGMIFQNPDNQIVASVVEEDVAFGPENMGIPNPELEKRVEESLKTVDMYKYRGSSPNRLSGGQKQRVAIAGVLAMKPKCIILDEPTAMLDPGGRREVIDAVTRLNREEGITVILITHYMEETVNSDKIFVMNKGKIVFLGRPEEVFEKVDMLESCNLEVPQAVYIAHGLRKKGIGLEGSILNIDDLAQAISTYKTKHSRQG